MKRRGFQNQYGQCRKDFLPNQFCIGIGFAFQTHAATRGNFMNASTDQEIIGIGETSIQDLSREQTRDFSIKLLKSTELIPTRQELKLRENSRAKGISNSYRAKLLRGVLTEPLSMTHSRVSLWESILRVLGMTQLSSGLDVDVMQDQFPRKL